MIARAFHQLPRSQWTWRTRVPAVTAKELMWNSMAGALGTLPVTHKEMRDERN